MISSGTSHSTIFFGDIIFQLVMFFLLLGIIAGIIVIIRAFLMRNKRLQRVEEKLDQLLEESRNKQS